MPSGLDGVTLQKTPSCQSRWLLPPTRLSSSDPLDLPCDHWVTRFPPQLLHSTPTCPVFLGQEQVSTRSLLTTRASLLLPMMSTLRDACHRGRRVLRGPRRSVSLS